ncbi:MAG: hypothetical protein IT190_09190, partial [Microbacteriaceae bacterium]|nr:hypothetical protein [Microbacteriaceae bacterium]
MATERGVRVAKQYSDSIQARGDTSIVKWLISSADSIALVLSPGRQFAAFENRSAANRADLQGRGLALGYGLLFVGREKQAEFVFNATDLMTGAFDLTNMEPGTWATAGQFMETAVLLKRLVGGSSGESFENATMRMLAEVLRALDMLRSEMHGRFDRIDASLWNMNQNMLFGFESIRQSTDELHRRVQLLSVTLDGRTKELMSRIDRLEKLANAEAITLCATSSITKEQGRRCLQSFVLRGTILSSDRTQVGTPLHELGELPEEAGAFLYANSYVAIAEGLAALDASFARDMRATPIPRAAVLLASSVGKVPAPFYLPHPARWTQEVEMMMGFGERQGHVDEATWRTAVSQLMLGGNAIQDFRQNVA